VIGTQECLNETKEWEARLQGTLGTDSMKLHFGRKVFSEKFIKCMYIIMSSKTVDKYLLIMMDKIPGCTTEQKNYTAKTNLYIL
jgi:hypothetical protein